MTDQTVQESAGADHAAAYESHTNDGAAPGAETAVWPEDWRARLSAGDQRLERRLGRFGEPRQIVDSLLAAEQRLRGGVRTPAPTDDDPTALAAWRAEAGVPETPDGYEIALPEGVVLGEADQPLVDGFLDSAHRANMTPEQVNHALDWYYRQQDALAAERASADRTVHDATLARLEQAWGRDFRATVNRVHAFLDDAPEGLKENLMGARLADGTSFGDSADAILWLERLARRAAPTQTLTPAGAGGPARAMADEIAAIERRMSDDRAGYFKDEAAQARYRELLEARARTGGR